MKQKILNYMIKVGFNKDESKKEIEKHYNDAFRIYGHDCTVKEMAIIIKSFSNADASNKY